MSNRAFLTGTGQNLIYPCVQDEGFDGDDQILACASYRIPVLWVALFRTGDIATANLESDGGDVEEFFAPKTLRTKAIRNLNASLPILNDLFSGCGRLDDHVEMLRDVLESTALKYVTIELHEIDCLSDPGELRTELDCCLAYLSNPQPSAHDKALAAFSSMADLKPGPFPPADNLLEDDPDLITEASSDAVYALLGGSYSRTVTWE